MLRNYGNYTSLSLDVTVSSGIIWYCPVSKNKRAAGHVAPWAFCRHPTSQNRLPNEHHQTGPLSSPPSTTTPIPPCSLVNPSHYPPSLDTLLRLQCRHSLECVTSRRSCNILGARWSESRPASFFPLFSPLSLPSALLLPPNGL